MPTRRRETAHDAPARNDAAREPRDDTAEIAALLERHLPRLRAFVRLRMGRELRAKESASDVVQSACREVLQQIDRYRFRSDSNFKSWLFTTALRKVQDRADYWRAGRRNPAREVAGDLEPLARVYGTFDTPSAGLAMRERVARFEAAFDRLSPEHREVITLARIMGLPHREVGAALGRTEAASRMLLYRALAALGAALGGAP